MTPDTAQAIEFTIDCLDALAEDSSLWDDEDGSRSLDHRPTSFGRLLADMLSKRGLIKIEAADFGPIYTETLLAYRLRRSTLDQPREKDTLAAPPQKGPSCSQP